MSKRYKYTTAIKVRFQVEGIHRWDPKHVGVPAPAAVKFLEQPHRHMFHWEIILNIGAARDIEFIAFKREAKAIVEQFITPIDKCVSISCEEMAQLFHQHVNKHLNQESQNVSVDYQDAITQIEVSEDGENAAILAFFEDTSPRVKMINGSSRMSTTF